MQQQCGINELYPHPFYVCTDLPSLSRIGIHVRIICCGGNKNEPTQLSSTLNLIQERTGP
jgi:hypothetical protein